VKVLPDSSIWIPFLRDPETEIGEELTRLLRRKAVQALPALGLYAP